MSKVNQYRIKDKKLDGRVKLQDVHIQSIHNLRSMGLSPKKIVGVLFDSYEIKVSESAVYWVINPDKKPKLNWRKHYDKNVHADRSRKHYNKKRAILLTQQTLKNEKNDRKIH